MTLWFSFEQSIDIDLLSDFDMNYGSELNFSLNMNRSNIFGEKDDCNAKHKIEGIHSSFTTNIPSFDHPDHFLQYLDKHFKPEINLNEEHSKETILKSNIKESITPDSEEIKLNYKGHKHMNEKGKNAERRDVAYKTFLRSVRRYLWELFSKKYDIRKLNGRNRSLFFKEFVTDFYNENFKSCALATLTLNEEKEENLKFVLSILLSEKNSFPSKTTPMRNLMLLTKSCMKKFDSKDYTRFLMFDGVSDMFKIIYETGLVHKIIEVYPKLNSSKDSYLKVVDNIINFSKTKTLLQSNLRKC